MFESAAAVVLTEAERTELTRRARARRLRSSDSQRAKLVLLLAEGLPYASIQERLECSAVYIRQSDCWSRYHVQSYPTHPRTPGADGPGTHSSQPDGRQASAFQEHE
jgi:hypothetical protein